METEPKQLKRGEVIELLQDSHGGIKKTMFYVALMETVFITVEDNLGPDFAVDVPNKADIPEGRNPMWYYDHCMLFGPRIDKRGNLYASPEG